MDQAQILLLRTLKKVNIPLHLLCQTVRLIECQKNFGDNIVHGLQLGTSYYLGFSLDRQSMTTLPKTTDEQKASTQSNREQGLPSSGELWLTANHMRHKYLDLMRLKSHASLAPWHHQLVQVNGEDFGKVVEKQLVIPWGINGRGVKAWPMDPAGLYNPEKAKASFAKTKAGKNKAFNSQFIWTTLSTKWTTAWSNKLAHFKNNL